MCDTLVGFSKTGMVFGKNSDRDPDEVQNLVIVPAQDYPEGAKVKCTYIEIPQINHTFEVLLSQPYWMWGAEIGVNEHGVCIGNEALFTRPPPRKENRYLLGMDLLRLGLERGRTAKDALNVIVQLLEAHGQGGNCSATHDMFYNNSFLIADGKEAYVLETVDKMWAWKQVRDYWSISNGISLTNDFDEASPDLIPFAIKKGWCKSKTDFNFQSIYSASFMTKMAKVKDRRSCTFECLVRTKDDLSILAIMNTLRSHGNKDLIPSWNPLLSEHMNVCAHATGLISPSQSTNSLITWWSPKGGFYVFSTGSSSPCTSIYKAIYGKNLKLPSSYAIGQRKIDQEAFWWRAEMFNRVSLLHYSAFKAEFVPKRQEFEGALLRQVFTGNLTQSEVDAQFTASLALMDEFQKKYASVSPESKVSKWLKKWKKLDEKK